MLNHYDAHLKVILYACQLYFNRKKEGRKEGKKEKERGRKEEKARQVWDFHFLVWQVKNLEVVTTLLTIRKRLN